MKNEAESQTVFAVSYVRNVRGRAMLPDSTVSGYLSETGILCTLEVGSPPSCFCLMCRCERCYGGGGGRRKCKQI